MTHFETVWYQSNDGLKLYARDYPCDNRDAELTLLCMHGLTRNSADFDALAPLLIDHCRVLVPDQRGRGESAWDPNPAQYNPGRYVADMFTLIDHLQLDNLVLLGTSMGGLMSMMMVAMKPDLFRGVVLNDIGPVVASAGLDRIKGYVGKSKPVGSWEDAIEQTREINGIAFPAYKHADWERWVYRMYRENENGRLELRYDPAISQPMANDDASAVPPDLWPLFDAMVSLPVLLIRGERSDILEPACVKEMQARHATMSFLEVTGVGHAPMLDEPGVPAHIESFLQRF